MAIEFLPVPVVEKKPELKAEAPVVAAPAEPVVDVHILNPEELDQIRPIFAANGVPMPNPETSFVMGAVEDGKVVGFLVTHLAVHTEPLHFSKGYEHLVSRVIHKTEDMIAERCGSVLVYSFVLPGKMVALGQSFGMKPEPWIVMSKYVQAADPEVSTFAQAAPAVAPEPDKWAPNPEPLPAEPYHDPFDDMDKVVRTLADPQPSDFQDGAWWVN